MGINCAKAEPFGEMCALQGRKGLLCVCDLGEVREGVHDSEQ